MVTLANPVAAAAIGLALLGERLQGGPAGILLALTGAGLAGRGVVLLSRAAPHPAAADHEDRPVVDHEDRPAMDDEDHPVAAVLALRPETASAEPALLPRPANGPEHLTPL